MNAKALPFPGGEVDASRFVARHGSDGTPTTLLRTRVAARLSEQDELLVKAAGVLLDGAPFIWVGPGILVPLSEVLPDERMSIVADYMAVYAARAPHGDGSRP